MLRSRPPKNRHLTKQHFGGGGMTINGHNIEELVRLAQQADVKKEHHDEPVRHFKK